MRVYVDTSAWIALVTTADPHHGQVAAAWQRLLKSGARPATTGGVVMETITYLRYHLGHGTAVEFWRLIVTAVQNGGLEIAWVDESLFGQGWEVFLQYDDQKFSMADCLSFAFCRRERIKKALTLDRHFQIVGIEMVS